MHGRVVRELSLELRTLAASKKRALKPAAVCRPAFVAGALPFVPDRAHFNRHAERADIAPMAHGAFEAFARAALVAHKHFRSYFPSRLHARCLSSDRVMLLRVDWQEIRKSSTRHERC